MTLLVVLVICCSGCSHSGYQATYSPVENSESQEKDRGAYTIVKSISSDSLFIGELLFVDDLVYFLKGDGEIVAYPVEDIVTLQAQLSRFTNRSYIAMVAIVVPSLLSFLSNSKTAHTLGAVGVVAAGPGLFASLLKNSKEPLLISYPDMPIKAFRKYARFPEGLPDDFKVRPGTKFEYPIAMGISGVRIQNE